MERHGIVELNVLTYGASSLHGPAYSPLDCSLQENTPKLCVYLNFACELIYYKQSGSSVISFIISYIVYVLSFRCVYYSK